MLSQYADDTYLIIRSSNIATRNAETDNIENWSKQNNFMLNRSSQLRSYSRIPNENHDHRWHFCKDSWRHFYQSPLSMFTASSARAPNSLYALKLLRAHGMCEEAFQKKQFRAVIISKICHASSAWWGFTSATDRQHVKAFFCHHRCPLEQSDLTKLVEAADNKLFRLTLTDSHILYSLPKSDNRYNLHKKHHNRELLILLFV